MPRRSYWRNRQFLGELLLSHWWRKASHLRRWNGNNRWWAGGDDEVIGVVSTIHGDMEVHRAYVMGDYLKFECSFPSFPSPHPVLVRLDSRIHMEGDSVAVRMPWGTMKIAMNHTSDPFGIET